MGYLFYMPSQKIAILGFSQEGKAVLKYLKKTAKYKNADITILDRDINILRFNLNNKRSNLLGSQTGKDYLQNLEQFDVIFRSPGVPYNLPEIQNAIRKSIEFSSSTKLFFEEAKKVDCKIIGITGTKGKGTTSTLLYKILKVAKKDVYLAGNIGKPAIELLPKIKKNSIVILELSSFQLQDLKQSPDTAVILNIFKDHLDSHKNFKEYVESKANIAKWQKKSNKIFYDADNKWSRWIAQKSPGKKIPVQYQNKEVGLPNIEPIIFGKSDFQKFKNVIKIPGEHNFKNAVMAAAVAKSLGVPEKIILKTIQNFRGLEHRLELVNSIKFDSKNVHSNILKNVRINFYNDSAGTNPFTAVAAIKAFKEPKILIAGGKDKNLDYFPLAKALKNSNTELVILFGENKKKIKKQIAKSKVPIVLVKDLKPAVNLAYKTAKTLVASGYILVAVLFSPASASFDMFKNYKERGNKFKEFVLKLQYSKHTKHN